MRRMYDSITASDLPPDGHLVGGYIDGPYKWRDWDWALFPHAVKVRIATQAATNDGSVLDVETGDATPLEAVAWVAARRAAGADPTIYTGAYEWGAVRAAFVAAGVVEPHYWIAEWDNIQTLLLGTVAKQYANTALTGGHYDASVVADYWPGVDNVDQYVTKAEFEQYKADLQKQLDANYAAKAHPHTATATTTAPITVVTIG